MSVPITTTGDDMGTIRKAGLAGGAGALVAAAVAAMAPGVVSMQPGAERTAAQVQPAGDRATPINRQSPASSLAQAIKAYTRPRSIRPWRPSPPLLKNKPTQAQIRRAARKRRNVRARSPMARKSKG